MTKIAFIDDDGRMEAYTVLCPLLERFGFKGCFAVIAGRIGRQGYMNYSQLVELQEKGHEIMSHSKTHPNMTQVSLPESIYELRNSKSVLEKLGLRVNSFVFPYNMTDSIISYEALKVYDSAFVGEDGNCELGSIKRIGTGGKRRPELRRWINNAIRNEEMLFLWGHSDSRNKLAWKRIRKLFEFIANKELTMETVKTILKQ